MNLTGKSNQELLAIMSTIESDPKNLAPPGGLWKLSPQARKKLDQLARAVAHNQAEKRKLAGDPVLTDGYSGRQTNRR
jgi:hypothetical protein